MRLIFRLVALWGCFHLLGCGSSDKKPDARAAEVRRQAKKPAMGAVDKEAVRRTIRDHLKQIRECYETELKKTPDLAGKIVLKWEVNDKGRVISTGVQSDLPKKSEVGACILAKIETWIFPAPQKGQTVHIVYPFVFAGPQ